MKGGRLVLGFGNLRNEVVDKVIDVRRKFSEFVINSEKQQSLDERKLGRQRHNSNSMSILGHTFFGSYGKS